MKNRMEPKMGSPAPGFVKVILPNGGIALFKRYKGMKRSSYTAGEYTKEAARLNILIEKLD